MYQMYFNINIRCISSLYILKVPEVKENLNTKKFALLAPQVKGFFLFLTQFRINMSQRLHFETN